MKKSILSILLLTLPFTITNAQVIKGEQRVVLGKACTAITVQQDSGDHYEFCMTPIASKDITTHKEPATIKKYMLLTGNNLSAEHHGATGNLAFVFEEVTPVEGDIITSSELFDIPLGEFGKAPTEFQFKDIGRGNFGYLIESETNYQGNESGGINIVGEYDGKIFLDYIPTHTDNSGYMEDENLAEIITYKIEFLKDGGEKVYPVKITLNGKYRDIEYSDQAFIFKLDEATGKYMKPENYPALI